jgi:hypothetical protein
MTRCPFCGSRGVKLSDERLVNDLPFRFDYCGHCGRNWPKDLSARVEADGPPPQDDTDAISAPAAPRVLPFGARVAEIAERFDPSGPDFKQAQGGDR